MRNANNLPIECDVPIRDVHLEEAFATVPKYFADGEIVLSHLFAALSATFPDGETYFVRSVAAVRDQITDAELTAHIDGFIGQESMHGREHRAFNARLAELGYPTLAIERYTDRVFRLSERLGRPKIHLAITAALEHYTATLAEMLLSDPDARACFSHDAVRRLFLWHSLEESEHKSVAFDVYLAVGGSERMRRLTMVGVHIDFIVELVALTEISVIGDPEARRHPGRTLKSVGALVRSPLISGKAIGQLLQYNRKGFHPTDRDTTELVATWRRKLFADGDAATYAH